MSERPEMTREAYLEVRVAVTTKLLATALQISYEHAVALVDQAALAIVEALQRADAEQKGPTPCSTPS